MSDPKEILPAIFDPTFDPHKTAIIEKSVSPPATDGAGPAGTVEVKETSSPDELEITATASRPCLLLISDNYANGWRAESLDKTSPQPAYEVIPADYTLRGIPLAAGQHHLLLRYAPVGFLIGKWVSLVALIAYAATAWLIWGWHPKPATIPQAQAGALPTAKIQPKPPAARKRRK